MSVIAGGTLTAAEMLIKQECSIAINWQGGWHHAQRCQEQISVVVTIVFRVFFSFLLFYNFYYLLFLKNENVV